MLRQWYVGVLCVWLVLACIAPWCMESGNRITLENAFAPPTAGAWLGTDDLGRSILLRTVAGAAVSAPLAAGVVLVSLCVGTLLGALGAWRGGLLDACLQRIIELFQAFPGLLLAIALAGILGPGTGNVALALCLVGWVGFARLARAQVASLRSREHVLVARALGTPDRRILSNHILPLLVAPLLVEATFAFAATLAAEAGMSFLGLGAQPPTAAWGSMLREATQFLLVAPHMLLGPGLAILSLVMAMQSAGERLRLHWQLPR